MPSEAGQWSEAVAEREAERLDARERLLQRDRAMQQWHAFYLAWLAKQKTPPRGEA